MADRTTPFVPADLDVGDFEQLRPLYQALHDRPIDSPDDLATWLQDYSDLSAAVSEYGARRSIEHSCHTDDPEIEKAYFHWVEQVSPKIKPLNFKLQKKALDSGFTDKLPGKAYEVLFREWRGDVELFREENIPLQTQVTKLTSAYDKLAGAMIVEFRGEKYTLQQLGRFLEEPDRPTRQEAWELSVQRRLQDRARMDEIFNQQVELRHRIAKNADLDNYVQYAWKAYARFDYTPEDSLKFGDAIEQACVPVAAELARQRRDALGLDTLRPWDMAVDPKGRPPLRPFDAKDVDRLIECSRTIFERISPRLGEQFAQLKPGRNLDLESRPGKRPGGYQSSLEVVKEPFIFMNAAGVHRDLKTMLHEGGHAFHYQAARDQPLVFLRHAPMEFCEVASMSMELIGDDYLDVFYNDENAARGKRVHLEGVMSLLSWVATIDTFQHWIYTHPDHTAEQRTQAWLDTYNRFSTEEVDWSGYEEARAGMWQRQLHLYHVPFYYIEYGIAQLGALQVWQNYRQDPERALSQLLDAFALGGTTTLPKLFEAAGIRFDFSERTLGPLMQAVQEELQALPV